MKPLKLEIGLGTARLLVRIVEQYLLRYDYMLNVADRQALYALMRPVVDYAERPPVHVTLRVEVVSAKDDLSVQEREKG